MSDAKVIRKRSSRVLVAFGPNHDGYDHPIQADEVKTIESYEAVCAEHKAQMDAQPAVPTLEQRIAVLESKVG